MDSEKEEHPSFGVISWSRMTTMGPNVDGINLFGSDLRHHNLIAVRIHRASRRRDLSRSWIHAQEPIAEVIMSSHQFAEFITSPNQGDGVPCTIRRTQTEWDIDNPQYPTEGQLHAKEFRDSVKKFQEDASDIKQMMKTMDKRGAVKKSDFHTLMSMVDHLVTQYESNLPFVNESFQKAMAKTVASGKQEIETYIQRRIHDAGLEHLGIENVTPQLLEADSERPDTERPEPDSE